MNKLYLGKPNAIFENSPRPTIRNINCQFILPKGTSQIRCTNCEKYRKTLHALKSRFNSKSCIPTTDKSIIRATIVSSQLNNHIIPTQEPVITTDLIHNCLLKITEQYKSTANGSFGHAFWLDQAKNMEAVPSGRRWHPYMIKWCLYINHLSSSAYKVMRKSECLALPSARTLRDYTHFIDNKAGFNNEVDKHLAETIGLDTLEDHQKYVCLLADEMKIKEGLVFSKNNDELLGFTNLGNTNESTNLLQNEVHGFPQTSKTMATSVFEIMV